MKEKSLLQKHSAGKQFLIKKLNQNAQIRTFMRKIIIKKKSHGYYIPLKLIKFHGDRKYKRHS